MANDWDIVELSLHTQEGLNQGKIHVQRQRRLLSAAACDAAIYSCRKPCSSSSRRNTIMSNLFAHKSLSVDRCYRVGMRGDGAKPDDRLADFWCGSPPTATTRVSTRLSAPPTITTPENKLAAVRRCLEPCSRSSSRIKLCNAKLAKILAALV